MRGMMMNGGPARGPMQAAGPGAAPTPPTIAEVVERVVGRFDGDADDALTLDELLAVLDPDGTHAERADRAAAALAAVDSDGDGSISPTELSAAVTALDTDADGLLECEDRSGDGNGDAALAALLHGRGPGGPGGHGGPGGPGVGTFAASVLALTERTFLRFDADDDGAITLAELVSVLDRHGRSTEQAEADAAAVLALADSSADQQLSAAEVQAVYAGADADADGLVQWAEFVALPDDYAALVGVPMHDHG